MSNRKICMPLIKIIISFLFVISSFIFNFKIELIHLVLYVIAYVIVGYDIVLRAVRNIFKGKVFDENFLMTIATIGAFFLGEVQEAVAVMLFYQVGELFQKYAVDKSRKSISSLMNIRPDYAHVYRDNKVLTIDPDEVHINEVILIKPGEKIPLDGTIIEGNAMINTDALTGESIPKTVGVNDEVLSGSINQDGILKVKVRKKFEESTANKILDLVENASSKKSKSEHFISKFSRIYTPIVVFIACLFIIIPRLVIKDYQFNDWLYRALSFLVVSCPCALVISIPLSFFGGIGAASKIGVLIKGSNYLEALAHTEIVVCDKTGTLTEGVFKVQKIDSIGYSQKELLKYAALAESFSNHPISLSLKQAYGKKLNKKLVTKMREIPGKGVKAVVDGKKILVGNEQLMNDYHIQFKKSHEIGTLCYVCIDHEFAGTILISDQIKEDSYEAVQSLRKNYVRRMIMLTGDRENVSKDVFCKLNIDEYHAELLPHDKVSLIEKFMSEKQPNGKLVFIGDGINDAPVLALSDIGVAMGGIGSDAAIEAADIVIMTDEPSKLSNSIQIAKKTMRVVRQNIFFAISVKIAILVFSAFGLASMWAAVFADVGVSVIAIVNALRLLKTNTKNS